MYRNIVIRVVIILAFGIGGFYVATETYFWLVSVWLFGFMLLAIYNLVRYLTRTRRQMADFLLAIGQDDFSSRIGDRNGSDSLDHAYNVLNNKLMQLRQNQASNSQFLQAVIEQVGIALIGYEKDSEKITVMNQAAKDLFKKPHTYEIGGLESIDSTLVENIRNIRSGEKNLVKLLIDGQLFQLSLTARELILEDVPYKLVSFQNIKAELEAQEVESWQKLIRVLTHEIKNSAIPISTLSEVIRSLIIDDDNQIRDLTDLNEEDRDDLRLGLETVGRRSQSLVNFVNAYGQLARLPDPKIEDVNVKTLIDGVLRLSLQQMKVENIDLDTDIDENLSVKADKTQIEQVLINLVKNAREAMTSQEIKQLSIVGHQNDGRVHISIRDTGPGMDAATMDKIFIPFYTTKSQGSGIGLSLSRQILRAHKGELRVNSVEQAGTTFTLVL